jgi:hypothetical protein
VTSLTNGAHNRFDIAREAGVRGLYGDDSDVEPEDEDDWFDPPGNAPKNTSKISDKRAVEVSSIQIVW